MKIIFFVLWSLLTFIQVQANNSQTNFYAAKQNEILFKYFADPLYPRLGQEGVDKQENQGSNAVAQSTSCNAIPAIKTYISAFQTNHEPHPYMNNERIIWLENSRNGNIALNANNDGFIVRNSGIGSYLINYGASLTAPQSCVGIAIDDHILESSMVNADVAHHQNSGSTIIIAKNWETISLNVRFSESHTYLTSPNSNTRNAAFITIVQID